MEQVHMQVKVHCVPYHLQQAGVWCSVCGDVHQHHTRHGGHRREIQELLTPLGRHFARCGIDNLSLQIIAGVKAGEEDALGIAEGFWISRLGTLQSQGGINSLDERKKI